MKQTMHIPVWRTILNWAIALVIGSIIWPLAASLFKGGPNEFEEIGGVMLISAILGGLTSLPAMLLLTLTNWMLNRNKLARGAWIRIHMLVHVLIGLLTFLVIYAFVNSDFSGREFFSFIMIGVSYLLAGIGTWSVTFMIYRRRLTIKPELREDILDELE